MSQVRNQVVITMKTLNGSMPAYRILAPAGANNTVKVWDTSTSLIIGVSTTEHSATGEAVAVAIAGTAKIMAGENISVGSIITAQTGTGKAVTGVKEFVQSTTSAPRAVGIALESASTGALVEVLLFPLNIAMTKV